MRSALATLCLLAAACAGGTETSTSVPVGETTDTAASVAQAQDAPAPDDRFAPGGAVSDEDLGKYHVSMSASIDGKDVGTMTFELWTKAAPITTRNFLRNCDTGFYDGLSFHRVMREFMVQGGCPLGTGTGESPLGKIKAEFSDEPDRAHGYGVLSMARGGNDVNSASSQFFLCCAESMSTWSLDGSYASFGKLTGGVETLEALANIETTMNMRREKSVPSQKAKIVKATVVEGAPPKTEKVERPMEPVDLGGEPERVVVQSALIQWKGLPRVSATRTQEQAAALAQEIAKKLADGGDFDALVREHSDEPIREGDTTPGRLHVLNRGIRNIAEEREQLGFQRRFSKGIEALREDQRTGKITQAEFQEKAQAFQKKIQGEAEELMDRMGTPRQAVEPAFADALFTSEVGKVGIVEYDKTKAPMGIRVFRRVK